MPKLERKHYFCLQMKQFLFIVVLITLVISACSKSSVDATDTAKPTYFYCDAETVSGDKLIGKRNVEFDGASARSEEYSRSGKYSLSLNKDNAYGFNYTIKNIKKGTVITAEVWKNKEAETGALVITDFGSNDNYSSSGHFRDFQDEWGRITTMFTAEKDFDSLKVFVYNLAEAKVYFDDFNIAVYRNAQLPEVKKGEKALRIEIPQSAQDSLNYFKRIALEQGVISDELKEYVRAYVDLEGEKAAVELRLKGDWTDHLETEKVSFRIKMGDGYSYDGLRTFSIQHPQTRSFAMEWFAHQLFEEEGVLTTRYEMIPVFINGKNCGVYAMEEHFDKQLLESRKRREGPIMKFDESGMWAVNKYMKATGNYLNAPVMESAEITVFKKGRTKRTPTLFAQFKEAQINMQKYRNAEPNVEEYMDLDMTAKYLALIELTGGKHGLTWHNQRFYFNPITQKLEPIAYDCFMEVNLLLKRHELIALKDSSDHEYVLSRGVLKDPKLLARYEYYLKKYSDPAYLKGMYKKLGPKIKQVEKLLNYEYPNIKLAKDHFEFNRKSIATNVRKLENVRPVSKTVESFGKLPEDFIYEDIALKANLEKYNSDSSAQMSVRNYHSHEIEIIGYSTKRNKKLILPISPVKLEPYGGKNRKEIRFPVKPRRIYYKAANCGDRIFKNNPEEWPEAKIRESSWNVTSDESLAEEVYTISGKLTVNKGLILPKYKALVIEAGSEIILGPGAYLVSHAPIEAKGTAENPIVIRGTNDLTQGFVCLSDQPSHLNHVAFDHLGTMTEGNWRLTGAVTFYNASVFLNNCHFTNNHCEDALNTIRCDVTMKNCGVANTYSDGFDADFCNVSLANSTFENTGNDCIDFSGSTATISNCQIMNSGDKGVSGGEGSDLIVKNCNINGAKIAIASKDKSSVTVYDITIENTETAFAAYRKKAEYGPATLDVRSVKRNGAEALYLLEKGSRLEYKNKTYVGKEKFDIDEMYAEFSK